MTVKGRVADLFNNFNYQLRQRASEISYYFLAMNESTRLIFICDVDENFEITEQLAVFCSTVCRTTSKEITNEMNKFVTDKLGLGFKNSVVICTVAAPAMCGQNVGTVTLDEEFTDKQQNITALSTSKSYVAEF